MDYRLVFEKMSMALHSTGDTAPGLKRGPTSAAQFLDTLLADLATLQFRLPGSCLNKQSVSWHRQNP